MNSRDSFPDEELRRRIMDFIMAAGQTLLENGAAGSANTGGGGGAGGGHGTGIDTSPDVYCAGGKGGSGIVVIRNHRED